MRNSKFKVRNPIDAFVLARLEQEKIEPSPEASRDGGDSGTDGDGDAVDGGDTDAGTGIDVGGIPHWDGAGAGVPYWDGSTGTGGPDGVPYWDGGSGTGGYGW